MQFGLQKNYSNSTKTAYCYLTENTRACLDRGSIVGAVFRDLQKAFDTVNHYVLMSKHSQFDLSINGYSHGYSHIFQLVLCKNKQ